MKDSKDYLHLYLGIECETPLGVMCLCYVDIHGEFPCWFNKHDKRNINILSSYGLHGKGFRFNEITPRFRHLSDITEEEVKDCYQSNYADTLKEYQIEIDVLRGNYIKGDFLTACELKYLLSKRFDLFNLIPEGLATYATTIKQ